MERLYLSVVLALIPTSRYSNLLLALSRNESSLGAHVRSATDEPFYIHARLAR
jgi:hypothetical protein